MRRSGAVKSAIWSRWARRIQGIRRTISYGGATSFDAGIRRIFGAFDGGVGPKGLDVRAADPLKQSRRIVFVIRATNSTGRIP